VGLLAHGIEARGLPTLVIGTARDILAAAPPPRTVFVDHPVGRTFGHPGAPQEHEQVLAAALAELPAFSAPGQIRDLPHQWSPDGDRSWEAMVREELLSFHRRG
jgi:D-proline reductase (dithiol) PrdB